MRFLVAFAFAIFFMGAFAWAQATAPSQGLGETGAQATKAGTEQLGEPGGADGSGEAAPSGGDLASGVSGARPISSRSMAHLYALMDRQNPLGERDLAFYEKNLAYIVALNDEPEALSRVLSETGWSEDRFVYVVTKVGLGVLRAVDPDNLQLRNVPTFAWPDVEELALIEAHLDSLEKAFQIVNPALPSDAPQAKEAAAQN